MGKKKRVIIVGIPGVGKTTVVNKVQETLHSGVRRLRICYDERGREDRSQAA
jgi:adenylate kinase